MYHTHETSFLPWSFNSDLKRKHISGWHSHPPEFRIAMSPEDDGFKFSAESYYATQPPPPSLDHDVSLVREFVARQAKEGRNVVLVTVSASIHIPYILSSLDFYVQSGGTTVPLELNV